MQKQKLTELITAIKEACGPVWVEIETNGSIAPPRSLIPLVNQFNVSPKLAHSGNDPSIALNPEMLELFSRLPSAFFKFVISDPDNMDQVRALVRDFRIANERVYLMPLGTSGEKIRERSQWLVDECLREGFRFSDRLHIHLFGDTRGT